MVPNFKGGKPMVNIANHQRRFGPEGAGPRTIRKYFVIAWSRLNLREPPARGAGAISCLYVRSASSGEMLRSSANLCSRSIALAATSDLASIAATRRCNALFLTCLTGELSLLENF